MVALVRMVWQPSIDGIVYLYGDPMYGRADLLAN